MRETFRILPRPITLPVSSHIGAWRFTTPQATPPMYIGHIIRGHTGVGDLVVDRLEWMIGCSLQKEGY
jgi:hypothetical protein